MCANSEGSDETVRMRRLALAFVGRLVYDKYHDLMCWLESNVGDGDLFEQNRHQFPTHLSHVTRKPVFGSLRPGKAQTGMLSYRD